MNKILPVILSGGSGTRLWPASRSMYPKQFLPLVGEATMLQETAARLNGMPNSSDECLVVCNEAHRFLVAEQMDANIHINRGITEAAFIEMREARDATLGMPNLILPSLQVNMRGGRMPPAEDSGQLFLKLPVNAFGGADLSDVQS